jgi:hypothetical protein
MMLPFISKAINSAKATGTMRMCGMREYGEMTE